MMIQPWHRSLSPRYRTTASFVEWMGTGTPPTPEQKSLFFYLWRPRLIFILDRLRPTDRQTENTDFWKTTQKCHQNIWIERPWLHVDISVWVLRRKREREREREKPSVFQFVSLLERTAGETEKRAEKASFTFLRGEKIIFGASILRAE